MSRGILILATTAPSDERWGALVERFVANDLKAGGPITVLREAAKSAWSLHQHIRSRAGADGFGVVIADSDVEHRAAALYKMRASHPVAVFKTRFDGKPLARGRFNHWLHNRMTAANLFFTHEESEAMRLRDDRTQLWMDNPYVLIQEKWGDPGGERMLAHACAALLQPTRDDPMTAPKRDLSHLAIAYVSHFYLNQEGKASVLDLLQRYASYAPALLDRIHFVIVDDGSPLKVDPPDLPLNLTWLRVRKDIPWNMAGARNLGAIYARADSMIVSDIDHEFPEQTLAQLVERGSCGKRIYKFWRKSADGRIYKCHPNTFFLSRGRFIELYGCDEEFAGAYGGEDTRFMKYQKARGSFATYLPKSHWVIEREDIDRKRGYHSLFRDVSLNTPVDYRKRLELEWYGPAAGHSRTFADFEWDVVVQRWRDVHPNPPVKRWWKPLMPLRQILPRF